MKKSIKIRLAVTYIVIMCLSLAVMLGVNSLFLEKYYLARKTDSLKNVYQALNNVDNYQYSALNDDDAFKKYLAEKNFRLIVVDPFGNCYSTTKDEAEMLAYMQFESQFSRGKPGDYGAKGQLCSNENKRRRQYHGRGLHVRESGR